jgi:hypothetical protein
LHLSELFREVNDIKQSESIAKAAKNLFRGVGHAYREDLMELEEVKRASSTLSPAKRRKIIKERLEKSENWWGVIEATRALYGVAIEILDYRLVDELEQQIDHIKENCGPSITWFQWQLVNFQRWSRTGVTRYYALVYHYRRIFSKHMWQITTLYIHRGP